MLTHKGKIELDGMIEDPMCTVVFLLEYILTENMTGAAPKEKRVRSGAAGGLMHKIRYLYFKQIPYSIV